MANLSAAASLMGRRSAQARIKRWGKKEFSRRMSEWGKLGGRRRESVEQGKIAELRVTLSAPVKLETPPLEPPLATHKKAKMGALVKKLAQQAENIKLLEKSLTIAEQISRADRERCALLHWQISELEERLTIMEGKVCRMPPSTERDELARILHAAQEEVVNGYLPPPSLPGPGRQQAAVYAGSKSAESPVNTRIVAGVTSVQPPSGGPEAGSGRISGRVEDEPPPALLSAASLEAISHVCKHRIRKR